MRTGKQNEFGADAVAVSRVRLKASWYLAAKPVYHMGRVVEPSFADPQMQRRWEESKSAALDLVRLGHSGF